MMKQILFGLLLIPNLLFSQVVVNKQAQRSKFDFRLLLKKQSHRFVLMSPIMLRLRTQPAFLPKMLKELPAKCPNCCHRKRS